MLAISYQLGAANSQAAAGAIDAGLPYYCGGDCFAAVVGRVVYANVTPPIQVPIPGTARGVAMGTVSGGRLAVMLENGDTYRAESDGLSWALIGNPVGGTVGTQKATWGELKTLYK
jgi:hypothetical protein